MLVVDDDLVSEVHTESKVRSSSSLADANRDEDESEVNI
jgi:hypothetical protein